MASVTAKVVGAEEVISRLRWLETRQVTTILKRGLRRSSQITAQLAAAYAPKGPRARLAGSIKAYKAKKSRRAGIWATVWTGSREDLGIPAAATGYYPAAQEFGFLHAHLGVQFPPKKYMERALEDSAAPALAALEAEVEKGLAALRGGRR